MCIQDLLSESEENVGLVFFIYEITFTVEIVGTNNISEKLFLGFCLLELLSSQNTLLKKSAKLNDNITKGKLIFFL